MRHFCRRALSAAEEHDEDKQDKQTSTTIKADCQVSYEYISSQVDGHGVMILSEFAGAAQSLNGSLIVNPCKSTDSLFLFSSALRCSTFANGHELILSGDLQSTADAIHTALTMTEEAKKSNWEKLFAVSWRFYG